MRGGLDLVDPAMEAGPEEGGAVRSEGRARRDRHLGLVDAVGAARHDDLVLPVGGDGDTGDDVMHVVDLVSGALSTDRAKLRYGVGKDPRCANCMMHCGFESASIFGALKKPADAYKLVKEGAFQNSGVGVG